MAFVDLIFRETSFLELPIHVTGEDARAELHAFTPLTQNGKPRVWNCLTVKGQAVTVESPRQFRVLVEGFGTGHFREIELGLRKRGVGFPKSIIATTDRQAGIHPHSGPCTDDQRVRSGDDFCGLQNLKLKGVRAICSD